MALNFVEVHSILVLSAKGGVILTNVSTWRRLRFPDRASPLIEQLIFFHDYTIVVLMGITVLVLYIMVTLLANKLTNRYLLEGQRIEFI